MALPGGGRAVAAEAALPLPLAAAASDAVAAATAALLLATCVHAAGAAAQPPQHAPGLTTGPDGSQRFLLGYNLGNVRFIPFSKAPLSHTPAELKAILLHALDDMKATGEHKE